jgi:hypothetical protein
MNATDFATEVSAFSAIVTAGATLMLWWVTRSLFIATNQLVRASSNPQIVVTIEINQWSMMYADIVISNTGNGTAFDIKTSIDPPIQSRFDHGEITSIPFNELYLLKPGQSISSSIGNINKFMNSDYLIRISWRNDPRSIEREEYSYNIDLNNYKNLRQLGEKML